MKLHPVFALLGTAIVFASAVTIATRGEDAPPPPPAPAATDQPAVTPAAEPTPPAEPAKVAEPAPSAATTPAAPAAENAAPAPEGLRRLDAAAAPAGTEAKKADGAKPGKHVHVHRSSGDNGNEKVSILHDTQVDKGESAQVAVSIFGSTTVDGTVSDAAVSIGGTTTVNGSAGDAAVAVMGDVHVDGSVGDAAVAVGGSAVINGEVHGDVVSVGGDVKLGPDAVVNGQVVVVGGVLEKQPTTVIRGNIQRVRLPAIKWVFAWVKSALLKGRLLSFASGAGWAWVVAAAFLGFYLLLALLFPRAITKCAETLEQRPGFTILAAFLTMLALPLVIVLLAITGVGVLVLPFLTLGLFVGKLFGRTAMLAWYGRRITAWFGDGPFSHVAVAVLLGGILVMLLYLVPLLAFMVLALNGILGLGMVIYTLILTMRRNGTKRTPAPVPAGAGAAPDAGFPPAMPAVGFTAPAGAASLGAEAPPVVPAVAAPAAPAMSKASISAAVLPRAGFWIRILASLLDAILIGVAAAFIHLHGFFLLGFAAYSIVLWALRGTTVGGVICGLKIVRLDDRPVDWGVAIVRGLAAFLSLAVVGLGFIWVVFDDEAQSWHDKIAGTTIVKVPKGISLV